MTDQSSANKPINEVRDGSMRIAIFKNEAKGEGDRPRYSGKLTRSYTDADGKWHDTEYLSGTEFLRAARLMERAYDEELKHRAESRCSVPGPST